MELPNDEEDYRSKLVLVPFDIHMAMKELSLNRKQILGRGGMVG